MLSYEEVTRDALEALVAERSAALRASEALVRTLMEQTSDGVILARGRSVLVANVRVAEMLGYEPGSVAGADLRSVVVDGEAGRTFLQSVEQVPGEAEAGVHEVALLGKNGTSFPAEVRISAVKHEGEPAHLLTVRDISERLRLADTEREYRQQIFRILDGIPVGVFVLDAKDGKPTYANELAIDLLGKGVDPSAGTEELAEVYQAVLTGTDELYAQERMPIVQALFGERTSVDDMELKREDRRIPLHVAGSPVYGPDGEIAFAAAVFIDQTAQRDAEDELVKTIRLLEGSNRELEQFAYVASHDLQEPLRMVASYTQLLAQRYEGKLDERADQYIAYATDGARRMQGLIEDLLLLSRVGTRAKPACPTDSGQVVADVLRDLEGLLEGCGARVRTEHLPTVMADETQLRQVFQNLIANAVKFRATASPEVGVTAKRLGGEWEFTVSDNGIGIEPRYHDRIFVIFQRLHARDQYPGSGVGLAIVKKIVERHGGRIRVDSDAGRGAHFTFTMPALEGGLGGTHG